VSQRRRTSKEEAATVRAAMDHGGGKAPHYPWIRARVALFRQESGYPAH
jgi:hypothetical protein